ncbi:MAG: hypothetical protein JW953_14630 [Anaerolineae bacterium]|nr:hypothetical protein [Anaerolineae bacterium]
MKHKFKGFILTLVWPIALAGLVNASFAWPAPKMGAGQLLLNTPLLGPFDSHLCPALPLTGAIVDVSTVSQLETAVNTAAPNTTIRVADGTYNLNGVYLRFDTPNVTLRSASGNREAVILDGNYDTTEIIQIAASNITIADLTLREAFYHPIHVMSGAGSHTLNTLIYNVHIVDPGEQAIKINPVSGGYYPDNGLIACSHIELTDAGRPHIRNNCYTGGVDAHQARGWIIRDNLIEGFWCASGLSEHGIHMWRGCRDTIVKRNVLNNNARGIGFGLETSGTARTYADNPCPSVSGGYVDHYGGIIRNNFVFANHAELFSSADGFDCGICLWQACGGQVLHNTVASTQAPFSSIEWRFSNTKDVTITNNLVTHNLRPRDGATAVLSGNLQNQPLSLFAGGSGGNLHLSTTATNAIDQGSLVGAGLADDDIDGDARPFGTTRDIGADEYDGAVTDLRVTHAVTGTGILTVTLSWTAPVNVVTTTLRYSDTSITDLNWPGAVVLTNTLPDSTQVYTAAIPDSGGVVFFALKSQDVNAGWSGLSNNAQWPRLDVYLPVILKRMG